MTIRASGYHAAFALLKGLGLLAALAAAAQAAYVPRTDAQLFADYVKAPAYTKYLSDAINGTEPPPLKAKCARLDIAALDPPLVLVKAEFAQIGNNYPISVGRWVARVTLNRCGTKVVRRMFIEADPQTGTIHSQALLPGEFAGNLQLEHDAPRIVLPPAMGAAKCNDWKSLWVLDTKLTRPSVAAGWSETWTMQACGRTVTADVIYTADSTGMNITAKNVKAH
ncbi:MAG TPA: hypothetical protein VII56_07690 [Rhizomicrobium sp.]